jgi:hypothetical protein
MDIAFSCSKCGQHIVIDEAGAGMVIKCPDCATDVCIPQPASTASVQATPDSTRVTVSPCTAENVTQQVTEVGQGNQRSANSNAKEEPSSENGVDNADAAQTKLADWHRGLPEAEPSYQASGKTTPAAVTLMLMGIPLGWIWGVVCGLLAVWLTSCLLSPVIGLAWFLWLRVSPQVTPMVAVILYGVPMALLFFAAAGWVQGSIVARLGRMGKNRNMKLVTTVSGVTAAFLPIAVWVACGGTEVQGFIRAWWWVALLFLACIVALPVAVISAHSRFVKLRFCEGCEQNMIHHHLRPLTYDETNRFVRALRSKDTDSMVTAMEAANGRSCFPEIWVCPECGNGNLELIVRFAAHWETGDPTNPKQELAESWMAISTNISPEIVDALSQFKISKAQLSRQMGSALTAFRHGLEDTRRIKRQAKYGG